MTIRYCATGSCIAAYADFAGIHKTSAGKIIRQAVVKVRGDGGGRRPSSLLSLSLASPLV
jgi:hypothetical protein